MPSLKTTSPYFTPYHPLSIDNLSNGFEMVWNFFATCHGYGEVDGGWSFIEKRSAKRENQTLGAYKMHRTLLAS